MPSHYVGQLEAQGDVLTELLKGSWAEKKPANELRGLVSALV